MSESQVVNACIRWLYVNKVFAWRNNSGSYKSQTGTYVRYGFKGSPDIIGILPNGQFLGIEAKYGKNKLSEDQQAFKSKALANNAVYITAYSVDDLENQLKPLL